MRNVICNSLPVCIPFCCRFICYKTLRIGIRCIIYFGRWIFRYLCDVKWNSCPICITFRFICFTYRIRKPFRIGTRRIKCLGRWNFRCLWDVTWNSCPIRSSFRFICIFFYFTCRISLGIGARRSIIYFGGLIFRRLYNII